MMNAGEWKRTDSISVFSFSKGKYLCFDPAWMDILADRCLTNWNFSSKLAFKKGYFFKYMFFEVQNKNLKSIFGGRI